LALGGATVGMGCGGVIRCQRIGGVVEMHLSEALWWPSGFARGNKTRRTTSETMRPAARGDTARSAQATNHRFFPSCRAALGLGQEPASEVVLVPSRHDEDDRGSRPQPRQQIGLPPIPMMGPGCSASARGGRRGRAQNPMARTMSRRRLIWLSQVAKRSIFPSAVSCTAWMRSLW